MGYGVNVNKDVLTELLDFVENRHFGKYRGTVVDNDDPRGRGRIEVQVPAVLGDLSLWAMPCVPFAGDQVGFFSLPNPGDGVWVEFEGGDPSMPIWTGCFWADGERPQTTGPDERLWTTGDITLRLEEGETPEVSIEIADGAVLRMVGSEIETDAGGSRLRMEGSEIVIDANSGGKVEVGGGTTSLNDGAMEVT